MEEPVSEDGAWETARTESISASGTRRIVPSAVDLPAGLVVAGKYRIVGKLGSGGMGVVYEAFHSKLRRTVALKIPFSSKLSATLSARLFREARVAAGIDPDRTARVFDVGTLDDGTPFLVLEKLDGENLAERLTRWGPMALVEAADFVAEACLGLAEVHRRGVVHRDLKPSNLFIAKGTDGQSTLRILDFGIASITHQEADLVTDASLTETGATLGSPPYMAPEQLRAANSVDARADVWALAATLHQLLTDKLPFPGSGAALVAAIVADEPRTLRDEGVVVPAELEQLLARCFSKNPGKRPADAASLGRELARFVSQPMRALLDEHLGPSTLQRPRAPRRLIGAAAVVLAAGTAAAGWAHHDVPVVQPETGVASHETPDQPDAQPAGRAVAPLATAEVARPPIDAPTATALGIGDDAHGGPMATVRPEAQRPAAAAPAPPPAPPARAQPRAQMATPPTRTASPVQGSPDLLDAREF